MSSEHKYSLLGRIDSPADLKGLSLEELEALCGEIRSYMVECCSKTPGHLGSSLGAVELIVGLHYVFDTPSDKILFDVSHQSYAHKIITGRREAFKNLRTAEGISGFTNPAESPYDAFVSGHSSTSISAALGFAEASRIKGSSDRAIALIGDGALTGGLAFEALNNAGASKANLLVVLNDNNQSIDSNKGGLHNHLLRITTSAGYNRIKTGVWNRLGESRFRAWLQRRVRSTKTAVVGKTGGALFESLGLRYFGPVDGNDIRQVVSTLQALKRLNGPLILHAITTKGKGYAPAEQDPVTWHAPGRFNPDTGERIVSSDGPDRYQDVFGATLCDLARIDSSIVGITPAMASGCGMIPFSQEFPDRFYDVGIEEEHAVTFSAALAAGGLKPFCNIYSAFSQRAYDQIIHDVALQSLPVVLCLDRAGMVGEDGATHHGAFDMAALRCIPGCIISAPSDEKQLRDLMYSASLSKTGPYIIRYPRGKAEGTPWKDTPFEEIPVGTGRLLSRSDSPVLVLALGPFANEALKAAASQTAAASDAAIAPKAAATVWDVRFLKPLDPRIREDILSGRFSRIITVEDGAVEGGLYSLVSEIVASEGLASVRVEPVGIADEFVPQGRQADQRRKYGLDAESLRKKILG